jgi:uncharacterized protein (DUF433 family)
MGSVTTIRSLLDRAVLTDADAARVLRVPVATLKWWLDGGTRHGKQYAPVIREAPSGSNVLTWGEFVEASYLREYRRTYDVSLQQLRKVVDRLRLRFEVTYPLASKQPWIDKNRRLVLEAQQEVGLAADLCIVVEELATGQVRFAEPTERFIDRVEFAPTGIMEAVRLWPLGPKSPIVVDPTRSSASPTVRGVRTAVLAELVDAGEDPDDVAHDFGLTPEDLKAALSWEWQLREAA